MKNNFLGGFAKKEKIYIYLLPITILTGLSLRLYRLAEKSIWCDEAFSILLSRKNILEIIWHYLGHPENFFGTKVYGYDAFHAILLRLLSGSNLFNARLTSAIFGIISILLIWKLASSLLDKKTGLIGALILAVSPFHVWYAQTARMYTVSTFLALVSLIFFLKLRSESGSLLNWSAYVLSSLLCLLAHPYGIFVILAENLVLILFPERSHPKRKWLVSQALILPLSLFYLAHLALQAQGGKFVLNPFPPAVGGVKLILLSIPSIFYAFSLGKLMPTISTLPFTLLAMLIWGTLFLLGLKKLQKSGYKEQLVLLSLLIFLPIAVALGLSLESLEALGPRHFIQFSPAFYMVVAYALREIKQKLYLPLLVAVILTSAISLAAWYRVDDNYGLKAGANLIQGGFQETDVIMHTDGNSLLPFVYYLGSASGQYLFKPDSTAIDLRLEDSKINKVWVVSYQLISAREQIASQGLENIRTIEIAPPKELTATLTRYDFRLKEGKSFPGRNPTKILLYVRKLRNKTTSTVVAPAKPLL